MKERFPKKRAGDTLSARDVNKLGDVARRFARFSPGGHQTGRHGDSFVSTSSFAPHRQYIFEVSEVVSASKGLCKGKARWYSHRDEEWKSKGKEWRLDAAGTGMSPAVGDKLVAWWDEQRGMFVPISGGTASTQAYFARLTEDLLCNQSAEARLYKSSNPPASNPTLSSETITVYDAFLPSGELFANTDVWVLYFAPYQRWYVLGLSCM